MAAEEVPGHPAADAGAAPAEEVPGHPAADAGAAPAEEVPGHPAADAGAAPGHWHPAVCAETGAHGWQWLGAGEPTSNHPNEFPKDWPFSPSSDPDILSRALTQFGYPGCPSDQSESEAPAPPTLPELLADLSERLPALKRCASELRRRLDDFEDCVHQVSHKLQRMAQQQQSDATSSQDPQGAQTLHSSQDD